MPADRLSEVNLGRYELAFWLLLILSLSAVVACAAVFVRQSHAINSVDVAKFDAATASTRIWVALALSADLLALVLAGVLRRWGWLVASILLPVSVAPFAVVMLFRIRGERRSRSQRASFRAAMAKALVEERGSEHT